MPYPVGVRGIRVAAAIAAEPEIQPDDMRAGLAEPDPTGGTLQVIIAVRVPEVARSQVGTPTGDRIVRISPHAACAVDVEDQPACRPRVQAEQLCHDLIADLEAMPLERFHRTEPRVLVASEARELPFDAHVAMLASAHSHVWVADVVIDMFGHVIAGSER
jgi:hypothetical protein